LKIGKDDHIHLLVTAPPKISVTNIVRVLKGVSARQLFIRFPELKRRHWKIADRHLWSPSYFAESIGTTNQDAVAKYIDDQRKKEYPWLREVNATMFSNTTRDLHDSVQRWFKRQNQIPRKKKRTWA
jgi:putative transposase